MAGVRAHSLYHRDQHYVVQNGEVVIVDEFTGRLMTGRRWSDGLHQAVEAKEGVEIQSENQTLASITFQNYFRLYDKLAGMTGTALTEATEFMKIYKLPVVQIPTNRPMVRMDQNDQVYKTKTGKWSAVVNEIAARMEAGAAVITPLPSAVTVCRAALCGSAASSPGAQFANGGPVWLRPGRACPISCGGWSARARR